MAGAIGEDLIEQPEGARAGDEGRQLVAQDGPMAQAGRCCWESQALCCLPMAVIRRLACS
jgi:hypothetical protein